MIRKLTAADKPGIYRVINNAARAYLGFIPDCWHEPYMPEAELHREMDSVTFLGWTHRGQIVGVMGFQQVKDVTLVRHAYVLTDCQGKGIGTKLLQYIVQQTSTKRLLVGTWADAGWAVHFYQSHGFRLMPDKTILLRQYWEVPERQIETSVVLGIEIPDNPAEH